MAKTSAQQMITDILNRMGLNSAGTQERIDCLRQLNISHRDSCQEHSLRFLSTNGTLTVVGSTCSVPATVDDGKAMTLGRVSGDGEIEYVEVDRWYTAAVDTYGQGTAQTEPTHYTIVGTTMLFKPAALNATVPFIAQLRVVDMTDAADSFSMLPEGWEDTFLMVDTEAEFRRLNGQPGVDEIKNRANAKREAMYGSYRTTKQKPWTDREQKERKIEKSQLSDEAMP